MDFFREPVFGIGVWVGLISWGYLSLLWRVTKLERQQKENGSMWRHSSTTHRTEP